MHTHKKSETYALYADTLDYRRCKKNEDQCVCLDNP